jgi:5-methyltetrahydrofolate--homocysteine methyltransferase
MTGLGLMNGLTNPVERSQLLAEHRPAETSVETPGPGEPAEPTVGTAVRRSPKVRSDLAIPPAPYLDRKLRTVPHLAEVWSYINPFMLYGKNLGYKGNIEKDLAERNPKALELVHNLEEVKREAVHFMKVKAVWQFFEAERDGNSIHLFAPAGVLPIHTFHFGRQRRADGLCLSDYVLDPVDGRRDHIAIFVATAGECIHERAEEWKRQGEYFKSIAIQALATETAEGTAEWLHRRIREDWGFPDPPTTTMHDRFTVRYRGKRYSFGYGACPNMDDQQGIWKLLRPEEIGVRLTEGMMMEPEASVSALVFHHPDCAYFTVEEN